MGVCAQRVRQTLLSLCHLDRPQVSRGWDSGLSWPQRIHPDP